MNNNICQHKTKDGNPLDGWKCRDCGELFREQTDEVGINLSDFIDRSALEQSLPRAAALKRNIAFLKGQIETEQGELDAIMQRLADALAENPEPIVDGERGIVATASVKKGRRSVDALSFAQNPENAPHIVELMRRGDASIPVGGLKAGRSAADDAALRFLMPATETAWAEIQEAK